MLIASELFNGICKNIETAKSETNKLRQQLSETDLGISDILHYLEFCETLSASQGYMQARNLKNLREARRRIKNELEELQLLIKSLSPISVESIRKTMSDLEHRQKERFYTPRVLTPDKHEKILKII